MSYASYEDIINLYGERELKNVAPLNPDKSVYTEKVENSLSSASSEVDAYLGSQYPVPLATWSPFLTRLTVNIAIYSMALSLGGQTDEHRRRYDDAIKYLTNVATGKIPIGSSDPTTPPAGVQTDYTAYAVMGRVDRTF